MTQKKSFIVIAFNINQACFEFLELSGNSMYEIPDNEL